MKKCSRCEQEQPLDNFPLRKAGEHTRRSLCKTCTNMYMMQYKRGHTLKPDPVDTKPVETTNMAQPNRTNIWLLPVYVEKPWGR